MIEIDKTIQNGSKSTVDAFNDDKFQNHSVRLPTLPNPAKSIPKKLKTRDSQSNKPNIKFPNIKKPSKQRQSKNRKTIDESIQPIQKLEYNKSEVIASQQISSSLYMNSKQQLNHSELSKNINQSQLYSKNDQEYSKQFEENNTENISESKEKQEAQKDKFLSKGKTQLYDISLTEMSDFQQKIIENKELIKKQVRKKIDDKNQKSNKKLNKINKIRERNQSLYQKRAREYKQMSQNKYLKQKKKEYIQNQLKDRELQKIKQQKKLYEKIKQRNQNHHSKESPNRYSPNIHDKKQKYRMKDIILQKHLSNPEPVVVNSSNLFENIQTILEHPHKSQSELISFNNLKLTKKINIPQRIDFLNKKKKQIELKQTLENITELKSESQNVKNNIQIHSSTNVYDWHRISLKNKNQFQSIKSSFADQIQRVHNYILKNDHSIEKYLENQSMLIQLQLEQKMKKVSKSANRTSLSPSTIT